MTTRMTRRSRYWVFSFIAAMCVMFVAAEPAAAQLGGPTKKRRGGSKQGPKQARRAKGTTWSNVGSHSSRILKFKPAKPEEEEKFVGTLKVLPLERDARPVNVRVRRNDDSTIELGGRKFTAEEFADIPWKGLYCTVAWGYAEGDKPVSTDPKKKPRRRNWELKSVSFDTVEVKGTVEEIEDDIIIIKVRPKEERPWPDTEARQIMQPDRKTSNNKPQKTPPKKLKLKMFDDVAEFVDRDRQPLDLGDFEVGQEIEASVVYGADLGIILMLQAPGIESEWKSGGEDRASRREQPRGRRGGGKTRRPDG